jgi:hypothetical protein
MDHVAIMNKKLGLINRILSGHKTIETRWYKHKSCPWDKVKVGEKIYFKDSGLPARASAEVGGVLQFSNLTPAKIKNIIYKYGDQIDIQEKDDLSWADNKNYAILIWLKNAKALSPFQINKSGFGSMSAWITINNIDTIRVQKPVVAERLGEGL